MPNNEYGQPGWRANSVLVLDVNYYYERSIENGLDPAHNEFVHPTHGHSAINRETYKVNEYEVAVQEQVALSKPFCRLLRFKRFSDNTQVLEKMKHQPTVLVVAPLSGHHSTLLRDTVKVLLREVRAEPALPHVNDISGVISRFGPAAAVSLETVLALVARTAGGAVDADTPLLEAGLDSLGAVELRNQLQQALER